MQSVEVKGLVKLQKALQGAADDFPKLQRAAHERLGVVLLDTVQDNIRTSLHDRHGKIAGWQRKYIGSGGGYAAIRAAEAPSGPNGAGAVTNYLENGHLKYRPKIYAKRQLRRVKLMQARAADNWVEGRSFYQKSRAAAPAVVQREAASLADKIVNRLR